jgi:hypothetical protein
MSTPETAIAKREPSAAPIPMGARGVALHTFEDVYRFAKAVSMTPFAPKDFRTPEAIAVAIAYGLELGLTPMQSLQGVAVVNGRPSLYGDALVAVVMASGLCEDLSESIDGAGDLRAASCTVKRRGIPTPRTSSFSVADAKKAGLWGKGGPWTQYSDRMLAMRARGFALRDAFADVLRGVISVEEAADIPAPTAAAPVLVEMPAPPAANPEPEAIDAEEVPPAPEIVEAFNRAVERDEDDPDMPSEPLVSVPFSYTGAKAAGRAMRTKMLGELLASCGVEANAWIRDVKGIKRWRDVSEERILELIEEAIRLEREQCPVNPEKAADLVSALSEKKISRAAITSKIRPSFRNLDQISAREADELFVWLESAHSAG